MRRIWQLGNTSVRSALRIKDGLAALIDSPLEGRIRSVQGDIAFRSLLGQRGVVTLGNDETNSVGRKWRSAMGKLGFLYPEVKANWGFSQSDLGKLDVVTPAGKRLVAAESLSEIQECFLRAMAAPRPQWKSVDSDDIFSPLRWCLSVLLELERRRYEPAISFLEMATCVQTSKPSDGVENVVDNILGQRSRREVAKSTRKFDKEVYDELGKEFNRVSGTFRDYADMNIRYLKATGMIQGKGRGISLIPEKRALAIELVKTMRFDKSLLDLYRELTSGSPLPTDNHDVAVEILQELIKLSRQLGLDMNVDESRFSSMSQEEINRIRYAIEETILGKKEEEYAVRQANLWPEIAEYMEALNSGKNKVKLPEGGEFKIPKEESSAYLEWVLWRAILAIDSLSNKPCEVRRFKVDQDFMPISVAPGSGPDMIADFGDYAIVVEVTLSESSRQEAMEGEPVCRHVADVMETLRKPVFGLFVANRVDMNTVETFRTGAWYTKEGKYLQLHIVPFSLSQFVRYFRTLFEKGKASPNAIASLLKECDSFRDACNAPDWNKHISEVIERLCG